MKLVATTNAGLEKVLAGEIEALGGKNIVLGTRAVNFEGSKELMYRANLHLRTAVRILQTVDEFKVTNEHQLYKKIYDFNWPHYFDLKQTFAVSSAVHSKYFNHSQYVALKTKDAIVDRFRADFGSRPNVNVMTPTLRVNVRIQDKNCTLSLDSSGDSLHKRGYRIQTVEAPISEVLAAGLILLSDWDKNSPLIDPMCGSATIAIEAALLASNIPSNYYRKSFGFQKWNNYKAEVWEKIKAEATEKIKKTNVPIYAFDKSLRAVKISAENIEEAQLEDLVQLEKKDFLKLMPPTESGTIIMNPPYDERLSNKDIDKFYKEIGDHLKQNFQGFNAFIISSNLEALKKVGLRASRRFTLYNGPLECKFLKYELYKGSKKAKKNTPQ